MLNIPDLEKRWLRYKLRSYLPATLIALSLITGVIIYTFMTITPTKNEHTIAHVIPKIEKKAPQVKAVALKNTPPVIAPLKKKEVNITTLSPSMNFMKQLKTSSHQTQYKPVVKTKKVIHKKATPKAVKEVQTTQRDKFPITAITITRQDTDKDIQNILKRFQEDKNPALSLFLAKKYYELGNYEEASKYALITNRLNKEIDDSWLIFSKALVKMHHKDKAMNILRKYIQSSHSTNAAVLLHDIQTGEFQ